MKKLILYTLLFLCPFIVVVVGLETLLRKQPNDYMLKGNFLKNSSNDVQIIILGSSHGITAIDPDGFSKKSFNTANYAQSLDIDYQILNKYEYKLNSLEYIIVPLSYHLLWTNMEDHPQRWRRKYYNIYYDINIEHNPLKRLLFEDETMRTNLEILKKIYIDKMVNPHHVTPKGFNITKPAKNLSDIQETAIKAIPAHAAKSLEWRYTENIEYLKKIIEIGKNKNAKVLLVTTPTHASFAEHLSKEQLDIMYSVAKELADNKDVFYYDGLNEFNRTDVDRNNFKLYFDADHLSYIGAKRFTQKLDSIIKDIDKQK